METRGWIGSDGRRSGKRCLFYTFNNQISGTVKQIGQNGILIEEKGEEQIINPDYIVRIREYPKNKKGKVPC